MKLAARSGWTLSLCLGLLAGGRAPAVELMPSDAPRASICLNGAWEAAPAGDELKIPETGWTAARVPAGPIVDPNVKARWQRLVFDAPKEWSSAGRRFFVGLEKAGHYAAVFCNGQRVGEHYGQYTPFEADVTDVIRLGQKNELAVYVHNASGRFVRAGADITDETVGKAYRPAANQADQRNWIGVMGDVTLSWRPRTGIADVFVKTSVREKRLQALVEIQAPAAEAKSFSVRATVLDGPALPAQPLPADGKVTLAAPWADPVLWGTAPYGEPKLYTLRTELLRDGQIVDRTFTRFGFREVWITGHDVMLNGKKLWLAGLYHSKLSPLRCLNDRRPLEVVHRAMQTAGLNALHGHWDDLGQPWLDLCDETGMFVLAGFFCDGRPQIQSKADAGWPDWMVATCAEWVRARRNHPSILLWRPTDVPPTGLDRFTPLPEFQARLAAEVRRLDPEGRPLADNSDIVAWGQPPENKETGKMDNWQPIKTAADTGKPFMNKEIYGAFKETQNVSAFFRLFYGKSFEYKSTGMLVQQLPLQAGAGGQPFAVEWPSQSGRGNRDAAFAGLRSELPNWCDPQQPASIETPFAKVFRDLFHEHMGLDLKPSGSPAGDTLITGLTPGSVVFLAPDDPGRAEPQGMLTAADGSAWFVVDAPGAWRLMHDGQAQEVHIVAQPAASAPGYGQVQRVTVAR